MSSAPVAPTHPQIPLQIPILTAKHFQTQEGVDFVNQILQQMAIAINASNGATGRVTFPHGLDVRGATISGLGPPENPSDAVSSEHAASQFAPAVTAPNFDIGGKNTLKGLASITRLIKAGATGTLTIPKLTGGGTNGSVTFNQGTVASFTNPT